MAKPAIDFLFDAVLERLDLNREVGRASAAEQLMSVIRDISDPVEQELYTEKLGKRIGVSTSALQLVKPAPKKVLRKTDTASANAGNAEEYCLTLILKYGNTNEMQGLVEMLTPEHFDKLENREVFNIWRSGRFPEEAHLQRHYDNLVSRPILIAGTGTLSDCIKFLEKERVRRQRELLRCLLRDAAPEDKVDILKKLDELREVKDENNGISETVDQSSDGEAEVI
jgi:DNA primase